MTLKKTSRLIQLGVLFLITLSVIYFSSSTMRANAWYFNAKNTLQQKNTTLTESQIINAREAIEKSLSIEPTQPHYLHIYGYIELLYLQKIYQQPQRYLNEYESVTYKIEKTLLASTQQRATWPQTWSLLAYVVSLTEGANDRVYSYLQHAIDVGPFELSTHLDVIRIALANWSNLSISFKVLYIEQLKLAVKHGPRFFRVFDVANEVNNQQILCLSLKFDDVFSVVRESKTYRKNCLAEK